MNVTFAEVLDRYSIELRKDYYGHGNPELVRDLERELREQISRRDFTDEQIFISIRAGVLLGARNEGIAQSEWQIRTGRNLSLEEVGRRTLLTRRLNDDRSTAKQELSEALKENVETRHFGYGDLDASKLTLDVQEPSPLEKVGVHGVGVPSVGDRGKRGQ